MQSLEISRVQSPEISRFCTLELEEDDSDIIIMRDANNFSNPVYDSMFGPGNVSEFFKVIRLG